MKRFRAAVIGGSGYGGAEIIRRLLIHPEVELARVASIDHVGASVGSVTCRSRDGRICDSRILRPARRPPGATWS
jgi:N-acetyl-gamma-glutamylphosphate reductase